MGRGASTKTNKDYRLRHPFSWSPWQGGEFSDWKGSYISFVWLNPSYSDYGLRNPWIIHETALKTICPTTRVTTKHPSAHMVARLNPSIEVTAAKTKRPIVIEKNSQRRLNPFFQLIDTSAPPVSSKLSSTRLDGEWKVSFWHERGKRTWNVSGYALNLRMQMLSPFLFGRSRCPSRTTTRLLQNSNLPSRLQMSRRGRRRWCPWLNWWGPRGISSNLVRAS